MNEGLIAIIVSIVGIIPSISTLVVSTIINNKVKKQNDLRAELNDSLNSIKEDLIKMEYDDLQRYLISQLAKIENGYVADEEEKRIIAKAYDRYHKPKTEGGLGGNSFVEVKYERLVQKGKI